MKLLTLFILIISFNLQASCIGKYKNALDISSFVTRHDKSLSLSSVLLNYYVLGTGTLGAFSLIVIAAIANEHKSNYKMYHSLKFAQSYYGENPSELSEEEFEQSFDAFKKMYDEVNYEFNMEIEEFAQILLALDQSKKICRTSKRNLHTKGHKRKKSTLMSYSKVKKLIKSEALH